jgi:hypothetical protein
MQKVIRSDRMQVCDKKKSKKQQKAEGGMEQIASAVLKKGESSARRKMRACNGKCRNGSANESVRWSSESWRTGSGRAASNECLSVQRSNVFYVSGRKLSARFRLQTPSIRTARSNLCTRCTAPKQPQVIFKINNLTLERRFPSAIRVTLFQIESELPTNRNSLVAKAELNWTETATQLKNNKKKQFCRNQIGFK